MTLPPSGEREPCPPCNPGFYNNDTATCSPCPPGTFSDGMKRTENFLSFSPHLSSTYLLFHAVSQLCFSLFVPQHVSSVLQALSPPWVMSTNGGMFFLLTWRLPVLMSAIPSVTVWMVGVYGKICSLLLFLSILVCFVTVLCDDSDEVTQKAWQMFGYHLQHDTNHNTHTTLTATPATPTWH